VKNLRFHKLLSIVAFILLPVSMPVAAQAITSYKECLTESNRITFACGANECPRGTRHYRTVREAIPECNPACVDMKALGWNNRGNKNDWCRARGYDGVRPAAGEYRNGGCCFKNPPAVVDPPASAAAASAPASR